MRPHHDLRVCQEAMELVTKVYALTGDFPADEGFGLASQIRRASISVPSNIAEGRGEGWSERVRSFFDHGTGFAFGTGYSIANSG